MDDISAQAEQKESVRSNKKATLRFVIAIAASLLFFCLFSPTAIPLLMLIVGFVMLGILFYGILKLHLIITGLQTKLRPFQRRAVLIVGVCLPLVLMILQSIGQLTIRDMLTLGGLFVVGIFYALRLGRSAKV